MRTLGVGSGGGGGGGVGEGGGFEGITPRFLTWLYSFNLS